MSNSPVILVTGGSRYVFILIILVLTTSGSWDCKSSYIYVCSESRCAIAEVNQLNYLLSTSTSLHLIQCDITQDATAKSVIYETLETFGRPDSIVLNTGTLDTVAKFGKLHFSSIERMFQRQCLFKHISRGLKWMFRLIPDQRSHSSSSLLTRFNNIRIQR